MNRCPTCEIKTSQDRDPTVRVPRPASNWIVNNSCPDKNKHTAREHTTSLCCCTDCQSRCYRCEHALVNRKREIRNIACLLGQYASETNIVKITNEPASGLGEGKRVSE